MSDNNNQYNYVRMARKSKGTDRRPQTFYGVQPVAFKSLVPQYIRRMPLPPPDGAPPEPGPMPLFDEGDWEETDLEETVPDDETPETAYDELAEALLARRAAERRQARRHKAWQSQLNWGRNVAAGNHIYGNNLAYNLGNIAAPALFSFLDRRRADKASQRAAQTAPKEG